MKTKLSLSFLSILFLVGCSSPTTSHRHPASQDQIATRDNTVCGLNQKSLQDRMKDCARFTTPGSDLILIYSNAIGTEYLLDKKNKLIWMNDSYDRQVNEHVAAKGCQPYFEKWPGDTIMRDDLLKNLQTRLPSLEEVRSLKKRNVAKELVLEGWIWTAEQGNRGPVAVFFPSRRHKNETKEESDDKGSASYRCVAPIP